MAAFGIMTVTLIFSQLLLQSWGLDYNPVPDLVKVRKREDAGDAEFVALDFVGLVEEHGRKAEQHNITTADGYKINIFRVPPNPNTIRKSGRNPVIFLGHGLAASADCFVIFGPKNSLAYSLSDAGYDVWLGNVRGNNYGREHERLTPDQAAFWNFSIDEFSLIDLRTQIDYTMNYTGAEKISYLGHSLGTTMVLMLLADRPEYVDKMDLVIHFAPVAYWVTKSPLRIFVPLVGQIIQNLLDPYGTTEILRQSSVMTSLYTRICQPNNILELCWMPFSTLLGNDPEQFQLEQIITYFNYYPAGASAKSFYHYRQFAQTSKFRKYDYENVAMNMKHYGQPEPPDYDLSHVNVPTVIFHAQNDPLSTVADTKALISHLHPNTSILYEVVPFRSFNHLDFVTAKDVKTLLYDRLIQIVTAFHKNRFDDSNNDVN